VRRSAALGIALVISALVTAPAPAAERPIIAASIAPLAFLVDRLAGESCAVRVLLPPGAEVETYEPSPQLLRDLARARVFLEVGHPRFILEAAYLEPFLARHPEIRRVSLGASAPAGARSGELADDPHLWVSPRLLAYAVEPLATALSAELPAAAAEIRARAARLEVELAESDRALGTRFAAARGRHFIIHHPALGFFAHDYGLVQEALEQEGKEPSPARIAHLLVAARRGGARAILVQKASSPRAAAAVAGELGARILEIDPLARDWPAALAAIGSAVTEALYGE